MKKLILVLFALASFNNVKPSVQLELIEWAKSQLPNMQDYYNDGVNDSSTLVGDHQSANSNTVDVDWSSSPISSDEATFLGNRKNITNPALQAYIGTGGKMPRVAFVASGGGFRAMLATLGFFKGAESIQFGPNNKYNLIDLATYMFGLSGSTWFIGPWSYLNLSKSGGYKVSDLENMLKDNISQIDGKQLASQIVLPQDVKDLGDAANAEQLAKIRGAWGQGVSFVDLWAGMIGSNVLGSSSSTNPNKFEYKWTDISDTLKNEAKIPMPLAASVHPLVTGWSWKALVETGLTLAVGIIALVGIGYLIKWAKDRKYLDEDLEKLKEKGLMSDEDIAEIKDAPRMKRLTKAREVLKSNLEEKLVQGQDSLIEDKSGGMGQTLKRKLFRTDVTDEKDLTVFRYDFKKDFVDGLGEGLRGLTREQKNRLHDAANPFKEAQDIINQRVIRLGAIKDDFDIIIGDGPDGSYAISIRFKDGVIPPRDMQQTVTMDTVNRKLRSMSDTSYLVDKDVISNAGRWVERNVGERADWAKHQASKFLREISGGRIGSGGIEVESVERRLIMERLQDKFESMSDERAVQLTDRVIAELNDRDVKGVNVGGELNITRDDDGELTFEDDSRPDDYPELPIE